ncbi:MAG TPA: GspE/PulE family protein [Gemmatimonadaceae bacterium]|nr:GspE/PulE family protein [Gemmatimonadaceae bacterium]
MSAAELSVVSAVAAESPGAALLQGVERLSPDFTAAYLERYAVLPLRVGNGALLVGTWREAGVDEQALDDLRLAFGAEVELLRVPEAEARNAIRRAYEEETSARGLIAALGDGGAYALDREIPLDDLVSLANEAPVVRLVNLLLLEALEARASDVHIEGYAHTLRVRYRVDGVLRDAPSPPAHLMPAVVSRLKIMAELDIAERRVPQDGRIRLRLQDRQVDVRVSTLPTLHGESIVLRLLDADSGRAAIDQLGMGADTLERFLRVIARPHGIVLATGPTGSGKTTTLYAAVDHVRTGREKILTVEDPVEYQLEGVPQVPVNEKVGVTFATALRALLRQDPDILLVGEIRDGETAEIATQAALTGHLVLSTLHTNDAPAALTRLLDLGVAPYLVGSTVEAVLAQRLVRMICAACKEEVTVAWPEPADDDAAVAVSPRAAWRGRGCAQCSGSGYRGRTGIYELLLVDDELRAELLRRRGSGELRRLAVARGMRTLYQDGLRQVEAGVTTLEEVLRVTRG